MQGLQFFKITKYLTPIMLLAGLAGCNLFDNKIQGQIGNSAGSVGTDRPKLSERIGLTSDAPEYNFDEGTRQDIAIKFSKPITKATTINWRIDGGADDFNVSSGSINLPVAAEGFEIPLIAMNDGLYEGEESFNLDVDVDEDYFAADLIIPLKISEKAAAPPKISFASSAETANEASGTLTVTVNMSQPSAMLTKVILTTTGSATMNSDFTMSPPNELVFSPGETSKTITVGIIDDAVSEGLEDITINLDQVGIGTATIDSANKTHSILIDDNDAPASPITITGVTDAGGGSDTVTDFYLTSGTHPSIKWTRGTLSGESGFDVTIYESNGVTIKCATINKGPGSTFADFPSCNLVEGAVYKVSVVANLIAGGSIVAQNNMVPISVDTVAPGAFTVIGAMGGNDIVPDGYLAGSLNPTIVWADSNGETKYDVKVLNAAGNSFDTTNCEVSNVPANTTSYTFENCTLATNTNYKARVIAKDNSGQQTVAPDLTFFVTNNQSGYLVLGVLGGTGDTTADENMDDGEAPRIQWQKALNADRYEVKITNQANTVTVCTLPGDGTVGGNIADITFTTCNLNLHQLYNVVVKVKTFAGTWIEAANSPYLFRNRVGLYIDGTGGSYINGLTITSCGGAGGDKCDSANPYSVADVLQYNKIRISNSGVLTGAKWTGNTPTNGNGVLTIVANYLTLDTGGKITMTGKGYSAAQGPGAGSSGTLGNGASHAGQGGLSPSGSQGPTYGDVLNPDTMGSGGGNGGSGTVGGAGGGIINITVNNLLELNTNNVSIEANGGLGTVTGCGAAPNDSCSAGGGGGAGGTVKITTEEIRGVGGAKISANGGGNAALGMTGVRVSKASAGGGGRVAFRYNINSFGSLTSLLDASGARTENYALGTSFSAAGTIFYKGTSDAAGFLVVGQSDSTIPHVQGVETPMPIGITFDKITTLNKGTIIVASTDIYQHFTNYIDFRLVVAGDLVLNNGAGPNHLTIGKDASNPGMIEWRRTDSMDFDWLTILENSRLTHSKNSSASVYRLVINAPTVDIFGLIDVSGRGYGMGYGPGRATGSQGASYGGLGGITGSGTRASVYGNLTNPVQLGSGGSTSSSGSGALGYGGGSVEIHTDTLTLKGQVGAPKVADLGVIRANGNAGSSSGGSGGSIKIVAKQVYGKYGTITADGGDGGTGGAGSGGRIAIFYERDEEYLNPAARVIWEMTSASPYVELSTKGGSGNTSAAAGTVYLKKTANVASDPSDEPADVNGHLWVYNSPRTYDERVTTVLADSLPLDSIHTDTTGTVHIPSGLTILLPTNSINYRMVVEGDYINPTPNDLSIASGGYVEWRKASPLLVSGGGTFTVDAGGVLTHSKNSSTRQYVVNVIADYMVVRGKIDAKGKGYGINTGPGASGQQYWGAAHAGSGSDGNSPRQGSGTPYAMTDVKGPFELGSGGFCSNGGGSIRLQVTNKLEFQGTSVVIDASAPDAAATCPGPAPGGVGGAASGGSIYISANEIAGSKTAASSPLIFANGGAGAAWSYACGPCSVVYGQSGSAGRIAITAVKDSVTGLGLIQAIKDKNITAIGGKSQPSFAAAAGTIYIKREKDGSDIPYAAKESLYLDNDGLTYYDRIETPIPDTTPYDEIVTLGNATLVVTAGQMFHLKPEVLQARLVVAGLFSSENNNLTVKSGGFLQWRRNTPLVLNNLTVESGGVLTHTSNFIDAEYRLELELQSLNLQQGAVIDVTGKGYQHEAGLGGGVYSLTPSAGAYGGNSRTALAYGSVTAPYDLGSGGGTDQNYTVVGGSGGGNVQIRVAGLAEIAGTIYADGNPSNAAGSGGTIALDVNQLKLSSGYALRANGGVGVKESGTGGRIAILYNSYIQGSGGPADVATAASSTDVLASGGTGTAGTYGAAGTIYYKDKSIGGAKGYLVIKNSPNPYSEISTTPLPDGADYDGIYVDPKAAVEVRLGESVKLPSSTLTYRLIMGGNIQTPDGKLTVANGGTLEVRRGAAVSDFTDVTIQNGGVVTHTSNTDLKKNWLEIVANNLTLDAGGKIDVSGKGYAADYGTSPGCIYTSAGYIFGGGSHGGFGSAGNLPSCSRQAYDSIKNPLDFGSGGGQGQWAQWQPAGTGGGLVKLNIATDLTLNGTILADGTEGACNGATSCGGSGAGGSINITAANLKGTTSSSLSANGGRRITGANEVGVGGGGRISLTVTGSDALYNGGGGLMTVPVSARGGAISSTYPAAAGTVWRKVPGDTNGRLFVSNYDTPYVSGTVTELFNNEAFDSITIGSNVTEASKTGIGIRVGSSFEFKTSNLTFPLVANGSPLFTGFGAGTLGNMTVKSGGIFEAFGDQPFTFNNVVVESGGLITHGYNGSALRNMLKLNATSLTINSGGAIDVSERGYAADYGPGAGSGYYGFKAGGGASFGGLGGSNATTTGVAGSTYGTSDLTVFTVGSGGGYGSSTCAGGSGGGGILLNVTTLQLNNGGKIAANGKQGANVTSTGAACLSGGGGSGGTVKIYASEFKTDNTAVGSRIEARGGGIQSEPSGDASPDGGGGGGGRVYIKFTTGTGLVDSDVVNWSLRDGGGSEGGDRNGSDGTLMVNDVAY